MPELFMNVARTTGVCPSGAPGLTSLVEVVFI